MERRTPHAYLPLSALVVIAVSSTVACGSSASRPEASTREPPNILLISLDTLRADHVSLYGYERETTPNLDRFARNAAVFDIAYSTSSTTGPSHATLFTGFHPVEHGVRKNGMELQDRLTTLAEVLRGRSYRTAAFVSSFALHKSFGWDQGFELFDDEFDGADTKMRVSSWQGFEVPNSFDRRGEVTNEVALEWLETWRGRADSRGETEPFFLLLHYFDAHEPYGAPPPFQDLFPTPPEAGPIAAMVAAYDREIAYLDHQLGTLFDYLDQSGLAENTLVVVTADHGQGLMQYGFPYHGIQIYEGQVRVPMIWRWPGRIPPQRIEHAAVSWFDVAPTILGVAGIVGVQLGNEGRDLSQALLNPKDSSKLLEEGRSVPLYRQHYEKHLHDGIFVAGEQFGLVQGPWKLIFGPDERRVELFRIDRDPGERQNLAARHPEQVEKMLAILQSAIDRKAPLDLELTITDEEREALEALGYTE